MRPGPGADGRAFRRSFRAPWMMLALVLAAGCAEARSRVVLYSAQDPEFAEQVLPEFTRRTGLEVATKFDTEASKSVSLFQELLAERNRPRCDVHWNNEILGTIRLDRQGMLERYDSPSARPYPAWTRSPRHTWQAFAARARVLLVNTRLVPDPTRRPRSIMELTDPRWKGQVGMAKPQFGTTATQAACLFEVLGREAARRFYLGLRANGVRIVAGNKQAAEGVSEGEFAVGLTDTDDAIIEVAAGKPVAMIFPDRDGHPEYPRTGTLFLPNPVALMRCGQNPAGARQLIDYLLGADVERGLAESQSHQIPLNPEVQATLPREMDRPSDAGGSARAMRVDFEKAADLWDEVQSFLRNEFARP